MYSRFYQQTPQRVPEVHQAARARTKSIAALRHRMIELCIARQ
jgi:hypothetical protein